MSVSQPVEVLLALKFYRTLDKRFSKLNIVRHTYMWLTVKGVRKEAKDITLREFQEAIRLAYFERDSRRGLERTVIWFFEEVGELARALLTYWREKSDQKPSLDVVAEEIADVLAWACSIANLLGIDVTEAVWKKYGEDLRKLERRR